MSNEPVRKRKVAEPASELETVQAALQRIESAVSDAAGRLRAELAEMIEVIGHVRQAVLTDSDPGALLNDLETRTARLLADLEGRAVGEPSRVGSRPADEQAFLDAMADARAPVDVPTVSAVVSRLGRGEEPSLEEPSERPNAVAKLEAMVEQLAATMRAAPATVEAATQATPGETAPAAWIESASAPEEPPADEPHEPIGFTEMAPEVLEFILQARTADWPEAVAPEAALEPQAPPEPVATVAPELPSPSAPARPSPMPDIELLDNFVRTTRPFIPPELGKAVIFEPRTEAPADIRPAQAAVPPPPQPEAAPSARLPLAEWPGPPLAEAVLVMPAAEPQPPSEPPAEPKTGETDLDAMLFEKEPEGDPDPAAMLLDDAPEAEPDPAASLFEPEPLQPAPLPQRPLRERPTVADPLAPLKAMSDEERIALFE